MMIPLGRLAAAALVMASAGVAQQPRPTFQSGARTVVPHATIRNSDGRLVPDLPREAFAVLDNGRPAESPNSAAGSGARTPSPGL